MWLASARNHAVVFKNDQNRYFEQLKIQLKIQKPGKLKSSRKFIYENEMGISEFFQISDFTESLLFYERSPVGVKKGSSQEIESLKTIVDLIFWIVTI